MSSFQSVGGKRSAIGVAKLDVPDSHSQIVEVAKASESGRQYRLPQEALGLATAAFDFCIILALMPVSMFVSSGVIRGLGFPRDFGIEIGVPAAVLYCATFAVRGGYKLEFLRNRRERVRAVALTVGLTFFVLGWAAFLTKTTATFSRLDVSVYFALSLVTLTSVHWLSASKLRGLLADERLSLQKVVVITDSRERPAEWVRHFCAQNGIEIAETVELSGRQFNRDAFPAACRNSLAAARAALSAGPVDAIYLFLSWKDARAIDEMRSALSGLPIPVHLFADTSTEGWLRRTRNSVGGLHGFELQRAPLSRFDRAVKRAFDIIVAGTALVALAPLMTLVALAIALESKGPIIFKQKRKGFGGRPFNIFKFRTMTCVEDGETIKQATQNDARVTKLGFYLRRSSVDELPQLVNVLLGHMSICGPRPHALAHDNFYDRVIARYAFRHHVKPGITGWAQVHGYRGETREVERMEARVEHDIWYVNNWSIWLDVRIVFRTLWSVWLQKNAY